MILLEFNLNMEINRSYAEISRRIIRKRIAFYYWGNFPSNKRKDCYGIY